MNPPQRTTAPPVDDIPAAELLHWREDLKMREIVVFVDGQTETAVIMEFAGELAQEHGAHLTGVFMQPLPASTSAEMFARGKGMRHLIEEHQAQLERIEAGHRARFDDIVRRHGIRWEWRSLPYWSRDVEAHAHYADLVVVARQDPPDHTAGPRGLVESLVLTSGRPVIVLPPRGTTSRVRRIVVGWNARREAVRAGAQR